MVLLAVVTQQIWKWKAQQKKQMHMTLYPNYLKVLTLKSAKEESHFQGVSDKELQSHELC